MVCISGHMSGDILLVSAVALPLVIAVTLCVSHFLDYISNRIVYPFVYLVLWGAGVFFCAWWQQLVLLKGEFHPQGVPELVEFETYLTKVTGFKVSQAEMESYTGIVR